MAIAIAMLADLNIATLADSNVRLVFMHHSCSKVFNRIANADAFTEVFSNRRANPCFSS
jgi:hypothetical protein